MTTTHVTLLVENLRRQIESISKDYRLNSLEMIFSRGRPLNIAAATSHHLRFTLFGIEADGKLPVAALTHVADRKARPKNDFFWLRTDPVTMWADMARVFMTNYGFADLNPYERNEIENCIRSVLEEEGFHMQADHPERWCIALSSPLNFEFTPLDDALGMDVAEALPDHPEARFWRRILNEIQVALHHCPVNIRRRNSGRQEINSVWFWGGGFIPEAAPHDLFDTVYSNNPVTRGLAIINDCRLKMQNKAGHNLFRRDGRSILIDWTSQLRGAEEELAEVEGLAGQLIGLADEKQLVLTVFDGSGEGRLYDSSCQRRFWRRKKPVSFKRLAPAGT